MNKIRGNVMIDDIIVDETYSNKEGKNCFVETVIGDIVYYSQDNDTLSRCCSIGYALRQWNYIESDFQLKVGETYKFKVGDKNSCELVGELVCVTDEMYIVKINGNEYPYYKYKTTIRQYVSEHNKMVMTLARELGTLCPSPEVVKKIISLGYHK